MNVSEIIEQLIGNGVMDGGTISRVCNNKEREK